jgi:hypothetical protein
MRMESRPDSDYTQTWSPSGEIEYAKLADGTRLRYLKAGSGPTPLILLHTVRTQLDHFQFVIPKILHAFTVYAIYFNEPDRGDHFAAWEEPELFSTEVRAAFRSLR